MPTVASSILPSIKYLVLGGANVATGSSSECPRQLTVLTINYTHTMESLQEQKQGIRAWQLKCITFITCTDIAFIR